MTIPASLQKDLKGFAMLMLEASSIISVLDQQTLDDLQVRYYLADELDGAALMVENLLKELSK